MLLEQIIDKIEKLGCIYNIHNCKAGWGFIMYYPQKDDGSNWRNGLSVEQYYPTIREATEETLRLLQNRVRRGK